MIRQVLVLRRSDFSEQFPDLNKGDKPFSPAITSRIRQLLGDYQGGLDVLPSDEWQVRLTTKPPGELPVLEQLVFSLAIPADEVQLFRQAVEDVNNSAVEQGKPKPVLGVGADPSFAATDYFCPSNIDQLLFGDRNAARSLTGAGRLADRGLTGNGVNIVVIDQGFDASKVAKFGGGLANGTLEPGTTTRGHGPMIVRNIVDAAPDATFYDVPLIPDRIGDLPGFISNALDVFYLLKVLIEFLRSTSIPPWNGPWVLVNAWSIFDRSLEVPLGDYTANPHHPLNELIDQIVDDAIDIVFAAGNCGQFCPDRRCGKQDRGPGSSIFGANSHLRVVTVGAVRTDARWMGSSSQGRGLLSRWKPDFCAPSYFRDTGDAFTGNTSGAFVGSGTGSPYVASTGSSAACGLTAGIIGAIRSGWDQTVLSPDDLKQALNDNARKTEGPKWNERLGHGIINVEETLSALKTTGGAYSKRIRRDAVT
jgi:subtilisin family serine protease